MTGLNERIPVPAADIEAGVARRIIDPPVGIRARNWGPADWNASEGQHRHMTLTAIAFRSPGDEPVVLITADATWWRRVADEIGVRSAVLAATGLPPERLIISLSHTHAGPVLCAADAHLEGGELIPGYLEHFASQASDAAREALAALAPARLEWAVGRCSLAGNRELTLDGRALVAFAPEESADDTVLVGRLTREGSALATIVNYACHPTTLSWQNRLVSPDYVGAMRDLVEESTGAPVAFLQGASGELAPREQYTGDLSVADRHGASLGHAVLAALAALPDPGTTLQLTGVVESGAPLGMWQPTSVAADTVIGVANAAVELDLVDLPSLDELADQWADIDARSREERLLRARNLREGYIDGPTVQHPVWVWRLGGAVLVAHPGEAYSHLQTALRSRFPRHAVAVANLSNGPGFVYLPSDDAYERGAYQAWQTPLAAGSLARLEAHAADLISSLV
jgi:hypothetical protein